MQHAICRASSFADIAMHMPNRVDNMHPDTLARPDDLCPVEICSVMQAVVQHVASMQPSLLQQPARTTCLQDACLNADITVDELSQCIKLLKRGRCPGIDGILADMIKGGGDFVQQCLL
jgi:hypothetical protein